MSLPRIPSCLDQAVQQSPDSPSRSNKRRREKPRIELAPDQPLTTQGKPRARVYVACVQCRTRKIRCDGAKPSCHNCTRRAQPADPCVYDDAPKRRGPDKTPGARQRVAREARGESDADTVTSRRRRRRTAHDSVSEPVVERITPSLVLDPQLVSIPPLHSTPADITSTPPLRQAFAASGLLMPNLSSVLPVEASTMTGSQGLPATTNLPSYPYLYPDLRPPVNSIYTPALASQYEDCDTDPSENSLSIVSEPSIQFTRQTWWDHLLAMYSSPFPSSSTALSKRQQAANQITSDLRFLFRCSNYWFSFINVPRFLSIYFDSESRLRMQPSFVLAALAISIFFQSSDAAFGREGRQKAMFLRDVAQGALEASLNARWINEELAQAAWLLALFEVCAHPHHTSERCSSGLVMLDTIIRTLSLTFIDMENPASVRFHPRSVPSILFTSRSLATDTSIAIGADNARTPYTWQGCSCTSRSLGQQSASAHEYTPLWLSSPAWDDSWSEAEIRKETCRRLCWSTLLLTAGHTSYTTSTNQAFSELFIIEPANIMLLFPGETIRSPESHSGKDTIWSLNYRTILLWHSCLRIRNDASISEADMTRFALDAWLEADALEKALDSHGCDLERTTLFQGREYLFNVRFIVAYEFHRYMPLAAGDIKHLFHVKAVEWLTHQANVAQRVVQSLGAVTGLSSQMLVHRPFFVFWFMSQISRALSLWECDNSLTLALDVGTTLFKPIDYLSGLWPCAEQRRRSQKIREELVSACRRVGRLPPPPSPF